MKKIFVLLLMFLLLFTVEGCNNSENYESDISNNNLFHDGLLAYYDKDTMLGGYLNKTGQVVQEPEFYRVTNFNDYGYAVTIDIPVSSTDIKKNIINDKFEIIALPDDYSPVYPFTNSVEVFTDDQLHLKGIMNSKFQKVVDANYNMIFYYDNDLYIGSKYGQDNMTTSSSTLIRPKLGLIKEYDNAYRISFYPNSNYGIVQYYDREDILLSYYRIIDREGKIITDKITDRVILPINDVDKTYMVVTKDIPDNHPSNQVKIIDFKGNVLFTLNADNISYDSINKIYTVSIGDNYKFYDSKFNEIGDFPYLKDDPEITNTNLEPKFVNNFLLITMDDSTELINKDLQKVYEAPDGYKIFDYNANGVVVKKLTSNPEPNYVLYDYDNNKIAESVNAITLPENNDDFYRISLNTSGTICDLYKMNGTLIINNVATLMTDPGKIEFFNGLSFLKQVENDQTRYLLMNSNGEIVKDNLDIDDVDFDGYSVYYKGIAKYLFKYFDDGYAIIIQNDELAIIDSMGNIIADNISRVELSEMH